MTRPRCSVLTGAFDSSGCLDCTSCPPFKQTEMSNREPSVIVLQRIPCMRGIIPRNGLLVGRVLGQAAREHLLNVQLWIEHDSAGQGRPAMLGYTFGGFKSHILKLDLMPAAFQFLYGHKWIRRPTQI